jgi:site-specific DNA-methyltransferase (adenine-specific)
MTQLIPLSSITIGSRQRKKLESQPLADLEESIRQRGLLHPPVYRKLSRVCPSCEGTGCEDDTPKACESCAGSGKSDLWQLIVGERRTTAVKRLNEKKITFFHDGKEVPLGMLPITTMSDVLSRADAKQVEFDENKVREPLTWQEEAEALAEIHRLRTEENPQQTNMATARQLIAENVIETHTNPVKLSHKISQSVIIAENLNNPTIAKARNVNEAYNLLLKAEEEKINTTLARRRIAAAPTTSSITIRQGSCLDILPTLDSNIADLILTDPPFGIGADTGGFRQRTVHHHNYEDTPEVARNIAQAIILDGFRIAKPMANLFIFCDVDLFPVLKEMSARAGWAPFRTPIIWQKSHSEGMAPWQGKGFRRTYEMIFWATKGQRGLLTAPVDILDFSRVPKGERIHAAQKPVDLLRLLIESSTLPSDFVLDPCCGSGSTLVAARELKRTGLGIEFDPTFYNTAMSNVNRAPKESVDDTASLA